MNTQEILKNANNISLEKAAFESQGKFCELWPTVKEGLQLLEGFIKNPIVKASIEVLISAGDAISSRVCK
ncbi:MAG TPA: hypothetical protein VNW95_00030 [Mucilaginibacter sp.]|jgi:hypothetical protein|nr:hypothetical protein [Mucilaginibacter sp.]